MTSGMGRVERTLYRSLLRLARQFDSNPALKALICRNHGPPLPQPLDAIVASFLGGPQRNYYWPPAPGGRQLPPRVRDAVHASFCSPPTDAGLEGAFMGMRYLSGLLAIARKHSMLHEASAPAAAAGQQQQQRAQREGQQGPQQEGQGQGQGQQQAAQPQPAAGAAAAAQASSSSDDEGGGSGGSSPVRLLDAPVRGAVLLSHPCLAGNIFSRSVVLVCRHGADGSYGLILNKPLGSSLSHLHEKLRQLSSGARGPGGTGGGAAGGGSSFGGPGGMATLGGGPGGVWEAALTDPNSSPGSSLAAAASAAAAAAAGEDVPADQLQQVVDFLAWKQGQHGAAAAAAVAAAAAAPEHDEYGNWLEPSSFEEGDDDEEEEADSGFSEDEMLGMEDDDDVGDVPGLLMAGEAAAADAAGRGRGGGTGRAQPDLDLLLRELAEALGNSAGVGSGGSADEWGVAPSMTDPLGVMGSLRDVLRRVGGGSVIMLDAQGQVWSHHLAPGSASFSSSDDEEGEESEMEGADTFEDDDPFRVAQLVARCLTLQDRLLLMHQEKLALEQQLLAAIPPAASEAAAAAAGPASEAEAAAVAGATGAATRPAAAEAGVAGASSGSGSDGSSKGAASKAEQLSQRVDRLLSQTSAAAAHLGTQAQLAGEQLQVTTLASLFGTSGPASSSSSSSSSTAPRGGSSSRGDDGSGDEGSSASYTVTQLMSLFKSSPLFRGGPVAGVQVVHQRPQLGGHLVLPPEGLQLPAAQQAQPAGPQQEAAGGATGLEGLSEAEVQGLEGGLLVGADLARAEELVGRGYLQPEDLRICLGDSGWTPGQLESEVERGTWAVIGTTPAFLDLFGPAAMQASPPASSDSSSEVAPMGPAVADYEAGMWSKCLSALGPEYAALDRVPKGAWEDLAELEV